MNTRKFWKLVTRCQCVKYIRAPAKFTEVWDVFLLPALYDLNGVECEAPNGIEIRKFRYTHMDDEGFRVFREE